MRVLLVNPNTSTHITSGFAESLPVYDGVEVVCLTAVDGCRSIESSVTSIRSAQSAYETLTSVHGDWCSAFDGVLVCCYSHHPLVDMLREADRAPPVVGIMQASLYAGLQVGRKVGVVTTAKRWEPLLEQGVMALGIMESRVAVKSTGLGVLELHGLPADEVARKVGECAKELVDQAGCDVISLGCAGMTGLEKAVRMAVGDKVPVLDSVIVGYETLLGLIRMKLKTSKVGLYA
ncbi:hypothetical protein PYCC9005_003371 [Savitreella phatthalungensis]